MPYPRQSTFQSDVRWIARFRGALVRYPGLRKYPWFRTEGENRGSALFFIVFGFPPFLGLYFSSFPPTHFSFIIGDRTVRAARLETKTWQAFWLAFVVFRTYLFFVSEFIALSDSNFFLCDSLSMPEPSALVGSFVNLELDLKAMSQASE